MANNSYRRERYGYPEQNNGRLRPYMEDGKVVMRKPYPLSLGRWLDDSLLVRALNAVLLVWTQKPKEELRSDTAEGWAVAEEIVRRVAAEPGRAIALVGARDEQATAMFERAGYEVAVYQPIPDEMTCAPRDWHATSAGHRLMLEALLETLGRGGAKRSGVDEAAG